LQEDSVHLSDGNKNFEILFCVSRFPLEEAGTKGVELCSLWQENMKNSAWHPFKVVTVDDKAEVCTILTCFVFIKEFCLNWLVGVVACNFLFAYEGR